MFHEGEKRDFTSKSVCEELYSICSTTLERYIIFQETQRQDLLNQNFFDFFPLQNPALFLFLTSSNNMQDKFSNYYTLKY